MPKIEFSREVTQEQYDLLQAVLKLNEQTFDQWMWENITASVEGDLENADRSPLAYEWDSEGEGKEEGADMRR